MAGKKLTPFQKQLKVKAKAKRSEWGKRFRESDNVVLRLEEKQAKLESQLKLAKKHRTFRRKRFCHYDNIVKSR